MAQSSPQGQIAQFLSGYWISQAVHVAAKLGIADLLEGGAKTADELAPATGTHARSLYRLLRALASVGVFTEDSEKRFGLTPVGDCLRINAPGSQHAMAVMMGEEHFQSWGALLGSIQTGETAFDKIYGKPIFDYLGEHLEKAKVFDAAMTSIHGRETQAMLGAYDFSEFHVLADIGGGNGSNLIEVLKRYPKLRGILFDLPHVVERARANLGQAGLLDRCELKGGSFFESIDVQADAYFLRHIIHDWNDEQSTLILKNIHSAMPDKGKLLLFEHVLPPGDAPSFGKLLDLNMLLLPGGQERTAEEYRALYKSAGFMLDLIVPAHDDMSVIEGTKIA